MDLRIYAQLDIIGLSALLVKDLLIILTNITLPYLCKGA